MVGTMDESNGKGKIKIKFFSNRGQFAIEAVLLATIFVGVFLLAIKTLKEKQSIQKLTDGSVSYVGRMAQYGTWREACKPIKGGSGRPETAANCHPNSINRALSSKPD